jgi:zinc and cadmium transporter
MGSNLFWYCIILFVAASLGGMVALYRQWSEDLLHLFVSFGAGVFLGAVFFELLPEAMSHENRAVVSVAILLGYLLIFFVEKLMAWHSHGAPEGRNHVVVSIAAMIGLSVHSLVDGLGMAVSSREAALGQTVFMSILAHHVPAAFSLASLLSLAKIKQRTAIILLALFAATPPIGALIFAPFADGASESSFAIILGLMTGTFLYVATGDLLPEVFHSKKIRWQNLVLLLLGILAMAAVSFGIHHVHEL